MIKNTKLIGGKIYIDGELWATISPPKCELFESCNCKTAMCRAVGPDESCYWYRYFKNIIEENKNE